LSLAERAGALAGIALERERRIDALRRSEDLLASINRNVNDGLFRATPDLRLVYVNLAFARQFGYANPDELLHPAEPTGRDDTTGPEQLRRLVTEQGGLAAEEVRFRRRDGSYFWGLVSSTAIRGPDGAVLFYDGAIADITARKELEEQFRQSQKMEAVGKLAGGIAHDFNNLLTAIFGYAEAIQKEAGAAPAVVAHAEGVLAAGKRAAGLTRQLLAYSRQQVLSPQVLELAAVVDHLGGMLRRLIGEDIHLVTQHAATGTRVRVDRGQLEQVILNLVVNARDAMPEGGTLTLRTGAVDVDEAMARAQVDLHVGPYVTLCVRDTGGGMPGDVRARAFDPFFTTKEQGRGTGLGLSTVYGIVKQSGGVVWLDSQPGVGTLAWVYLPRVEAPLDAEVAPTPEPAGTHEATVLVVEDEPVVRELVRETLRRAGYAVLTAIDGLDGLEVSRRHGGAIDLVVTDVVMPRMGGRELAERLRVERPGVKMLFMSGYPNDAFDLTDLPGAAPDFISKPFTSRDLVARTQGLLHPGAIGR
jgi:PAS domain S-box-containing protein